MIALKKNYLSFLCTTTSVYLAELMTIFSTCTFFLIVRKNFVVIACHYNTVHYFMALIILQDNCN